MSEAICTCHCGGAMFYRHLHAESCILSREGEEAPKSELQTLREERDRLREALQPFAERWEYFERTKHPSGGEWPEDLEYADDEPSAIYLGQLKAAKAALTPAGQRQKEATVSEMQPGTIQDLLAELVACAGVFDVSTDYEADKADLENATQAVLDHVQALRDERDRLRANLVNCVARLEAYYGEDYPAVRDARAALTPAGGGTDGQL